MLPVSYPAARQVESCSLFPALTVLQTGILCVLRRTLRWTLGKCSLGVPFTVLGILH